MEFFTLRQVCYILGVSRHVVGTYLKDGRLSMVKLADKQRIKIPLGSVEHFIAHYLAPSQIESDSYKEEALERLQEMQLANVKKHGISPIFLERH